MIKNILHGIIRKVDKTLGVPSDYFHFIVDHSVKAFFDFLMFMKLANHREKLPKEAWHMARILSTHQVDCGTCVQITVNLALKDRMPTEWIQAILDQKPGNLPIELQDVYAFTQHILQHTYQEEALRETIRNRYGNKALIDLAYAIASAQVFPYTKKVLGFAKSCSKVQVKLGP